jgi:hypothetical protein
MLDACVRRHQLLRVALAPLCQWQIGLQWGVQLQRDVRFWHLAGIAVVPANVRFWG